MMLYHDLDKFYGKQLRSNMQKTVKMVVKGKTSGICTCIYDSEKRSLGFYPTLPWGCNVYHNSQTSLLVYIPDLNSSHTVVYNPNVRQAYKKFQHAEDFGHIKINLLL